MKIRHLSILAISGALFLLAVYLLSIQEKQSSLEITVSTEQLAMIEAANHFLELIDSEQLGKALLPFESEERFQFNYVPMNVRTGLMLKEMTAGQRMAVHSLLKSVLSNTGYLKVTGIMHLEEVLYYIEGVDRVWDRDPEQYYVTIFGTPSTEEPWGWRFEGHHLSLNFSSVTEELFSSTPAFLGSNPAQVRTGPYTGLRVLGEEEDLGRMLYTALNADQKSIALINNRAPGEIVTSNQQRVDLERFEGLPASGMSPDQKGLLWRILEIQAHNLKPAMAELQLDQIRQAGMDSLHFAWAGGELVGEPHYFRIHGPTVLYEYDNVQNNANHIHTVLRDLLNDFGDDHLLRHYETAGSEHGHDN